MDAKAICSEWCIGRSMKTIVRGMIGVNKSSRILMDENIYEKCILYINKIFVWMLGIRNSERNRETP